MPDVAAVRNDAWDSEATENESKRIIMYQPLEKREGARQNLTSNFSRMEVSQESGRTSDN